MSYEHKKKLINFKLLFIISLMVLFLLLSQIPVYGGEAQKSNGPLVLKQSKIEKVGDPEEQKQKIKLTLTFSDNIELKNIDYSISPDVSDIVYALDNDNKALVIVEGIVNNTTSYKLAVNKGIKSESGTSLGNNYTVSFDLSKGEGSDVTKEEEPKIVRIELDKSNSSISNNSDNIDLSSNFTLAFTDDITSDADIYKKNRACINLFKDSNSSLVDISISEDSGDKNKILIKPDKALSSKTQYRIRIDKDLKGITKDSLENSIDIYFTTRSGSSEGGSGSKNGNKKDKETPKQGGLTNDTKSNTPSKEFSDVQNHWAKESIMFLSDKGAISGKSGNRFAPNDPITRAEFCSILVKSYSITGDITKAFNDTGKHWAKESISVASSKGIVEGNGKGSFAPDSHITREQVAVMLSRAGSLSANQSGVFFSDKDKISSWAIDKVNEAQSNGIVSGYKDGTFKPKNKVTRAEACQMISNLVKLKI